MSKRAAIFFTVILASASNACAQQFFADRAAFLARVSAGHYAEPFTGWSTGEPLDGHQAEWESPGENGFSWTASAIGPGNNLLYSLNSALSTSSHDDALIFHFSGDSVYVFGGDFWATQYDGFPLAAEITFETDNGEVFTHTVSDRAFLGIVSDVPLTSVSIDADGAPGSWPTADSIITGALNPEGDLDGDGMSNGAEQIAGTRPTNVNSYLRITSIGFDNSGTIVNFPAVADKTYRLEYKTALTDPGWSPADADQQTAAVTGPAQFLDPIRTRPVQRLYRIIVVERSD